MFQIIIIIKKILKKNSIKSDKVNMIRTRPKSNKKIVRKQIFNLDTDNNNTNNFNNN